MGFSKFNLEELEKIGNEKSAEKNQQKNQLRNYRRILHITV
jgi:hypothetical protein